MYDMGDNFEEAFVFAYWIGGWVSSFEIVLRVGSGGMPGVGFA